MTGTSNDGGGGFDGGGAGFDPALSVEAVRRALGLDNLDVDELFEIFRERSRKG